MFTRIWFVTSHWVLHIPRHVRHLYQKLTCGWTDADTWNLDHTIAVFVLPRLKRFSQILHSYPGGEVSEEKWDEILAKMIWSMEAITKEWEEDAMGLSPEESEAHWARVQEGLDLFGKHFRNLWD